MPELHHYRPHVIVDEFERTMLREMDFRERGSRHGPLRRGNRQTTAMCASRASHWELTGPSVLALEEISGRSAQYYFDHPEIELDRKAIAEKLARSFIKQLFEVGLFHADPHPGNLLIQPPRHRRPDRLRPDRADRRRNARQPRRRPGRRI